MAFAIHSVTVLSLVLFVVLWAVTASFPRSANSRKPLSPATPSERVLERSICSGRQTAEILILTTLCNEQLVTAYYPRLTDDIVFARLHTDTSFMKFSGTLSVLVVHVPVFRHPFHLPAIIRLISCWLYTLSVPRQAEQDMNCSLSRTLYRQDAR